MISVMEFLNKDLPKMPVLKYSRLNTEGNEASSKKTLLKEILNDEQKHETTHVTKLKYPCHLKNLELNLEDHDDNDIIEDINIRNLTSKNTHKPASLLNTISEFGKKIKSFLHKTDAKQDLNASIIENLSSLRHYQSEIQIKSSNSIGTGTGTGTGISNFQKAASNSSIVPLSERSLKYDKKNTKPFSRLLVTNVNDVNGSMSSFKKSVINLIQDEKERTRLSVVAPHPKGFMSLCTRNLDENLNLKDHKSGSKRGSKEIID